MSIIGVGGPTYLNNLIDVEASTPSNNDGIFWSSSNLRWESGPQSGGGGPVAFNDLTDVIVPSPGSNDFVIFDGADWRNETPATAAGLIAPNIDLDDLGDVNTGSPGMAEDGYVLQWDFTLSEYNLTPAGGSGVSELNDLTDVTITTPANGEYLVYNSGSGDWENTSVAPGSGIGGSGTPTEVAYFSALSTITSESRFVWDPTNGWLELGTSPAASGPGALMLDNGSVGAIRWRATTGTPMGLFTDAVGGGDAYVFYEDAGLNRTDFYGDLSSTSDLEWRFGRKGTGLGNVHAEGAFYAHNTDGFGASVPVDANIAFSMEKDNYVGWGVGTTKRIGYNSTDDTWEFTEHTGANRVSFTSYDTSGSGLDWRFSRKGAGKGNVVVEGTLSIHDADGFTGNVASVGSLRLPQDGNIYSRTGGFNKVMLEWDSTTNRVGIGTTLGTTLALWPANDANGALVNDGGGNLSWGAGGGVGFDLDDLDDVVVPSPTANDVLQWNGANWVDSSPATIVGQTSVSAHSDVTGSPTSGNILLGNGANWVSTAKTGFLALNDLTDTSVASPTANDLLQWNGANWVDSSPATIVGQTSVSDHNDVTIAGPSTGHLQRWSGSQWVNVPPSTVAGDMSLGDLSDVTFAGVAINDLIVNNGAGQWINFPLSTALSTLNFGDLGDVTFTGLAGNEFARRNPGNTAWINTTIGLDDLDSVSTAGAATGEVLRYTGSGWAPSAAPPARVLQGTATFNGVNWVSGVGAGFTVTPGANNPAIQPSPAFATGAIMTWHAESNPGGGPGGGPVIYRGAVLGTSSFTTNVLGVTSGTIVFTVSGPLQ